MEEQQLAMLMSHEAMGGHLQPWEPPWAMLLWHAGYSPMLKMLATSSESLECCLM